MERKYGSYELGKSNFIIVAPHGLDDLATESLALKLAKSLQASYIINTQYCKPSNPLCENPEQKVWDFNKLPWYDTGEKYIENLSDTGLQEFVSDILASTRHVQIILGLTPCVIYIHGMKNRGDLGVDIGIGVRIRENSLLTSKDYAEIFLNSENIENGGSVISDVRKALAFKVYLQEILLKQFGLRVGIGEVYFTGRKEQLPQIHRHLGYQVNSLQLELCKDLRDNEEVLLEILIGALNHTYRE